jgi:Na+/H+ antiporter NhaD/arsenite permease-like protein
MAPPAALPAILIFAATYFVLALGRLPGFRVDRTGAAIIGAALMVAVNALTLPEAVAAINTDTILLLFGMMIVVANLRLSGIFALITEWVVEHAHRPLVLLAAIVGIAGVFSAFFVNDVGSEEARLRASHRPPLKLHVRFSRMQLSRRLKRSGRPEKELIAPS